jgi:hypothetical protein
VHAYRRQKFAHPQNIRSSGVRASKPQKRRTGKRGQFFCTFSFRAEKNTNTSPRSSSYYLYDRLRGTPSNSSIKAQILTVNYTMAIRDLPSPLYSMTSFRTFYYIYILLFIGFLSFECFENLKNYSSSRDDHGFTFSPVLRPATLLSNGRSDTSSAVR